MPAKIRDVTELVLVLPELAALPDAGSPAAAAGAAGSGWGIGRFSAVRRLPGGWRGWLARSLRFDDLAACDVASVVAAALAADGRGAWLATPLQLAAGMRTVHVPVDGILEPGPAEAQAWALDFARVFGGDGLRLEPLPGGALVLLGLEAPGVRTVEPAALLGRSLEDALPAGGGAARLRALMTEIEMWLHEHPLNADRLCRGEAAIGSLWLWGGGGPACGAPCGAAGAAGCAQAWGRLYADDPWVAAVASLSGTPLSPPPSALAAGLAPRGGRAVLVVSPGRLRTAVAPADGGLVDVVDRVYLRPALQALRAGELGQLTLVAGDRAASLRGSDRLRFWRPARDWPRALAG